MYVPLEVFLKHFDLSRNDAIQPLLFAGLAQSTKLALDVCRRHVIDVNDLFGDWLWFQFRDDVPKPLAQGLQAIRVLFVDDVLERSKVNGDVTMSCARRTTLFLTVCAMPVS